jgi:hypothetical protein
VMETCHLCGECIGQAYIKTRKIRARAYVCEPNSLDNTELCCTCRDVCIEGAVIQL